MIIPIRCFTCNANIASKYKIYLEIVSKINNKEITTEIDDNKTPEENSFNILNIKRYCCRRHLISHIDLINKI